MKGGGEREERRGNKTYLFVRVGLLLKFYKVNQKILYLGSILFRRGREKEIKRSNY